MSQEDLPQKDNDPKHSDYERKEGDKGIETKRDGRLTRAISWLFSVWFIVPVLTAVITVLINYFVFSLPPFYEQARLEQSINLADKHVEFGNTFLQAGELEAANEEFDKALQLVPGHTAAQQGAFKVDVFLDVSGGEPEITGTFISEPSITRERLLLLAEEYPKDADIRAYLGLLSPTIEKALDNYKKAVDIDPEHALAYSGMAFIYRAQGNWDQHLKMAKKAYEFAEWKTSFANNYANALGANGRFQDAIAQYERIIYELDPQFLWAYLDLAGLYRLTGDIESAYFAGIEFLNLSADEEIMSQNRNTEQIFSPNNITISTDTD